ncbi:hypothetical protein SAMN06265367_102415 [Algoriphagus winogradskyi]|uniref:Uncharacterized protein n=1 Tax=Algoriphagus winogradskyi TaxID=237017 RepID=A0ABY1NPI0_9BACT|nr:hypothetical protein SAMN06265367_102415 [Algoriphagus winogradskyi]
MIYRAFLGAEILLIVQDPRQSALIICVDLREISTIISGKYELNSTDIQ